MWKNYYNRNDFRIIKTIKRKSFNKWIEIENQRVDLLNNLNFISPYIELPKKLTVRQNLEVYGRLYDVKNLKKKLNIFLKNLDLMKLYIK